jgi:hypothetical protein
MTGRIISASSCPRNRARSTTSEIWSAEEFRTAVEANLASGTCYLVIVVDDLSDELARTIEYARVKLRPNAHQLRSRTYARRWSLHLVVWDGCGHRRLGVLVGTGIGNTSRRLVTNAGAVGHDGPVGATPSVHRPKSGGPRSSETVWRNIRTQMDGVEARCSIDDSAVADYAVNGQNVPRDRQVNEPLFPESTCRSYSANRG